ncbi:DNA polymerase III gamma/tau subunit [Actinomadura coerulea]|uniref:DNA polymerase III gamma/tau subunit n=1 Tax=Actinomadura coerulea TaxID=46159 RepID=A0A7X0G5T7_9ACTN|nr:hypothetical protein [Actinomadura coerulea]MBB6399734.1 DNA polymerase III gamma/tau subunit [Actinomadura coerulea]GGQ11631.1 hypothetical protein GCM10010187_29650 [Actinomadura coerulea]
MKRILRTMAVTGITMGAAVLAAPSAMADINFYAVEKAYVGHNGPSYISEKGPGDLIYTDIVRSPKAAPVIGNKPVKTGDITTKLHGGKHNTAVTDVEGSEQEATKVALAKAAEHQAAEQQAAPEAAPQQESLQAAPEQGAEQAAPQQGEQQAAPQQEAQQNAPQQEAEQAAPQQDAQQAAPEQGAEQAAPQEAQQQEAQQQEAQQQEAQQQEAQQQEAQQNAPEQQQADANAPQAGQRLATTGDHPKPVNVHAVKKAVVGQNGPVSNSENGSGDAIFTNLSGSPRSNVYAGNSATMTGPITNRIHGGTHNTVINAIEGPEQESTKR